MEEKFTFLKEEWFMWLMLVIFAPVGIFLMWKYNQKFKDEKKFIIAGIFLVIFVLIWFPLLGNSQNKANEPTAEQITAENLQVVQSVEKKIKAFREPETVTVESIEKVKQAKNAYNGLTSEQKGMVSYETLKILVYADDKATILENKAKEEKAAADKVAADKAAADKAVADQAAAEKAAADKAAADQAAAEKAAADKAAADQAAADKAAAEQAAAQQTAANTATDSNGNVILPANTQWVRPLGHFYVGVDLYYLNHNKEGILYATVVDFADGSQKIQCYMYESDTLKWFNRNDPQFTGTFLHVRADDPHLQ